MSKKFILGISVIAIAILAFGTLGTGAWWSIPTTTTGSVQAATFNVTAGAATGTCLAENLAPGDDAVTCKIDIINNSSIPVNVLWSGFTYVASPEMENYIFITEFSDSNGTTHLSDIMGFDANGDGKLSLKEAQVPLNNGWFSDPNNVNSYASTFVAAGETAWVQLSYAFGASAPNTTIGGSASFDWKLEARQLPKNSTP